MPATTQFNDRYKVPKCGVAQTGCGVAQIGSGVAQMVVRRLAVRQAQVRFSARQPREVFLTERASDEEMERNLGEWRRMNVLYEYDGLEKLK